VPRWVKAIPSAHPRCRVCHHPHAPSDWHVGSPDDWSEPGSEEEARTRALELFHREFGFCSGERQLLDFIGSEERRIRRESPEVSFPELVKRVAAAMRARGLSGSQGS
jgi:hypothetical protein